MFYECVLVHAYIHYYMHMSLSLIALHPPPKNWKINKRNGELWIPVNLLCSVDVSMKGGSPSNCQSPLNVIQFQAVNFFSLKIVCDTRYANASFYTQSTQWPMDLPCDSLEGHFVSGAAQSRITPDVLRHVMGMKEKSGICGLAIQFLPSASFPPR